MICSIREHNSNQTKTELHVLSFFCFAFLKVARSGGIDKIPYLVAVIFQKHWQPLKFPQAEFFRGEVCL